MHFAAREQLQILRRSFATPSGHCLDLRALVVGTEPQRRRYLSKPSSDLAAVPSSSLGPLRQIDAGLLNVGRVDSGLAEDSVVILLHSWPYDIDGYLDVAPLLATQGYRVIIPYLRGYGSTHFLSEATPSFC